MFDFQMINALLLVAVTATDLVSQVNEEIGDEDYDYESNEGVCKLSHNHKEVPSAEPRLDGQCRQWRNNSCCRPGKATFQALNYF